ncbi:MAG: alpha-hydroxy-acid oxidizing protein, partial [Candidatus Acidiferrales bacterium]
MERELEIYQHGATGKKLSIPVSLSLLEQKAKETLEPRAYDYVAGGAGGENTMRANLEAFHRWRIVPRMLRDVSTRDLSVELLGAKLPAPVLLGPVGVQGIIHGDAEVASGRAAAELGLPFVLSTVSSRPMEEVAQAMGAGPRWFQLSWGKNPELTASMLQRAERTGYSA